MDVSPHLFWRALLKYIVQDSLNAAASSNDACTSLKLNCSNIISCFSVCFSLYPFLKFFRPILLFSILNEEKQMNKTGHRQP